jgi:peptidoglycan/xylan/chitin deacetylase (PgdA/CDA1 family)
MEAGTMLRSAALLLTLFVVVIPLNAQSPAYAPKPERFEILMGWEKVRGVKPPEMVAGIYEKDYQHYDFGNEIAITIDDCGPNKYMAAELDTLKKHGVKAVFFIIGNYFLNAEGKPMPRAKELLDRVVNEGHIIGSHSYWHKRLDMGEYRDNRAAIEHEVDLNQATIDKVLGHHYPLLYFRPPNGAHSTPGYTLDKVLRDKGQYLTNWTITSFDWCIRIPAGRPEHLTPAKVIARTVKQAREESGGVVLLHGFPDTARILDALIVALSKTSNKRGPLVFSTLGEIMRRKYEAPGVGG